MDGETMHKVIEALRAMSDAFDIGQTASKTSAIGKCRGALRIVGDADSPKIGTKKPTRRHPDGIVSGKDIYLD